MSNAESSNTIHKTYNKREDKKYWGVYWLNKEKYTMSHISAAIGISKATVQNIIKRIKEKGTPTPEHHTGAPKKLNERDIRQLQRIVRDDPFATYAQINSQSKDGQIDISRSTLIRYMKEIGFGSYFAAHKPKLSEENKKRRLRWAKERVNWTMEQWNSVVWSDESRFTVESYGGGARVFRKVGERYQPQHIVPTTKWGKGNVMIWSCFWAGGFGPLVFIDGSVDQDTYVNILSQKFLPWFVELSDKYDKDFVFQEDGATCHTGGYATWWKNSHSIRRFDYWSAQSPDLNPIEHIWSCFI